MNQQEREARASLITANRIVFKFGSRVLVNRSGRPDSRSIKSIVKELARVRREGREIIMVTSGAIASGVESLGLSRRPADISGLQMAAAVGQVRLISHYEELFGREGLRIGQVLLTHDDLRNRTRHLNARNTMLRLLKEGVVPVVNENDVVASEEIKFGDNDVLASLVSILVDADLLVLLSSTDGLRETGPSGRTKRVPFLAGVTEEALALANGKSGEFSTGGMLSKLQSARTFAKAGGNIIIADGRKPKVISTILKGSDVGTLIQGEKNSLKTRKEWIAFFSKPGASVVVDRGAEHALRQGGKSLLPIGVSDVEGVFEKGSIVNVRNEDKQIIARGLVSFSSEEVRLIKGKRTSEMLSILGPLEHREIIHRDNLVIIR